MPATVQPWTTRLCLAALLATAAVSAAPARSEAFVYWTGTGPLGRAEADGTNVQERFIPSFLNSGPGLAVDQAFLYGTDNPQTDQPNTVIRANIDGTGAPDDRFIILPNFGNPRGVAVSESHVYWASDSWGPDDPPSGPPAGFPATIRRANIDGTAVNDDFISLGSARMNDLFVHGGYLYWAWTACPRGGCGGAIGRANPDGSGVNPNFIVTAEYPSGVAVDDQHIYWTNVVGDDQHNAGPSVAGASTIGRADFDGGNVDQRFITGATYPLDVVVGDERIYWSNFAGGSSNLDAIGSALLDGSSSDQSFIEANSTVSALAVDGRTDDYVSARFKARPVQHQRGGGVDLKVKLRAREPVTSTVTATVHRRELKPKRLILVAHERATLTLRPARRVVRRVLRAELDAAERLWATARATVVDAAGNREVFMRRIKIVD